MVDATSSLSDAAAHDVQATFCSTLVDEWIRLGVRHAVVAPGSRSTPMALALTERDDIAVHVGHDERVAAFTALGIGLSGTPSLLLCTSGTAAANFFPAVVEAGLSEIPMIVLTADRPEELRGVGAPQTIDQIDLYGTHVRWSVDVEVADADRAASWRPLAAQAWSRSTTGPVHVNLPFREPLIGTPLDLPAVADSGLRPGRRSADASDGVVAPGSWRDAAAASGRDATASGSERADLGESDSAGPLLSGVEPDGAGGFRAVHDSVTSERGLILVGGAHGVAQVLVRELGERAGWPIVADPLSGMRDAGTITSADSLLRVESFASSQRPDVIVRVGRPSTSKVLAQWVSASGATLIQVGGPGRIDPGHDVTAAVSLGSLLDAIRNTASSRDDDWRREWMSADRAADRAIVEKLAESTALTEPQVARTIADHLPAGARLTVSSSMPVRDLEWFGGPAAIAHCNRGANGIDGVLSTAVGRGLAAVPDVGPDVVLIGDLAFVHDSNALVAIAQRGVDLRVVVVDNDGGGIFSFLPQATALENDRFERLFGTPLGADVLGLAAAHGVATRDVSTVDELIDQLAVPGPWVCRVTSDRSYNVEVHAALNTAVADVLS